jgi:AraC-like DNA-binding protein
MWAKSILGLFVVYTFLILGYKLIIENGMYTIEIDYAITAISCLSIGLIAWYGYGFPEIADGQDIVSSLFHSSRQAEKNVGLPIPSAHANEPLQKTQALHEISEKYKNSGLPPSFALMLADRLEALMVKEKLFSENDLSLNKLAEKLGTSKHFVSQVINQHFQMNFFDYVNLKRIEEAKRLLRSSSNVELNIIEIAYIVGFNNKGTFNAIFKKHTGATPSQFRSHTS